MRCSPCNGTGKVTVFDSRLMNFVWVTCPKCKGSGKVSSKGEWKIGGKPIGVVLFFGGLYVFSRIFEKQRK